MVTKDLPVVNNDCMRTTHVYLLPNVTINLFTGSLTIYNDFIYSSFSKKKYASLYIDKAGEQC
jgi:hypothetical protein